MNWVELRRRPSKTKPGVDIVLCDNVDGANGAWGWLVYEISYYPGASFWKTFDTLDRALIWYENLENLVGDMKIEIENDILRTIIEDLVDELTFATKTFKPYNSSHEGYAVILEELDELWDEIKDNKREGTKDRQRKEALQVATTAVRFIYDLI